MNSNIGAKISLILEKKNITAQELAQRANLRKDQVDIILSNKFTPSITMLKCISQALEVSLNILMDGTEESPLAITRSGEQKECLFFGGKSIDPSHSIKFASLSGNKADREMDPFTLTLNRRDKEIKRKSSHEGEEFIYILSGSVELLYGDTIQTLTKGDSIYFDSVVPHAIRALEDNSTLLCVINTPWK